ncbi:HBS1 N-terminus-domain-containing protein [Pisolithus croceorrhizus]|nr:HBS1 N-terminus-domain-containing protein [Pisolithus croceorrhizus]
MSRHRLVRNINIQDELDDDALSDGGDEVTDEQYAQLESGLTHVRAVMGDEAISALDDGVIKDALWEHYFDVEKAVAWLYEEQERRIAAKERKALPRSKSHWWERFRRKGDEEQEVHQNGKGTSGHYEPPYSATEAGLYPEDIERPRGPLIMLAQHGQYQPDYCPEDCMACSPDMDPDDLPMGFMPLPSRLSTITELTERTEPSCPRHSRQQLARSVRASQSTDTTSSYGQVLGPHPDHYSNMYYPKRPLDPNEIPPSPSPSAVHRLSIYESAPSALPTESGSEATSDSPKLPAPSISVPPVDTIPDIPDSLSKVSDVPPPPPEKDFPSRRQPAKRSKLATLASSRVSTISSSRSSALETTSVLTYPALRPSPESRLSYASRGTTVETPPSETSEKSEGTVRGIPAPSEKSVSSARTPSTTPSSMSSHVRRAIDKAMELEQQNGREETPRAPAKSVSKASISTTKPPETSPSLSGGTPETSVVRNESGVQARPQSKLAKLAQAKANGAVPLIPKSIPRAPPVSLPKPRTEYLTPIANGATATTAITTSYQTLHSLSTARTPQPVPLVQMTSTEGKQSKLASKAKKAQTKPCSHSSATDDEGSIPTQSPLFLSKPCHSRALPSAFASLLLDDRLTSLEADKHRKTPRYGREELKLVDTYSPQSRSTLDLDAGGQRRCHHTKPNLPDMTVQLGFAFDVPSPDDIVFNARRGTSLAQQQ